MIEKLEKNKFSQSEVVAAISLLESRNVDVSSWKQVEEKIEEKEIETPKTLTKEELKEVVEQTRKELVEKVDTFIDTLISAKRSGVYTEVMKALGGKFESDLDELLENATIEQLKDALSFDKIKPAEKVVVKKSKTTPKTIATKGKKDAPKAGSKSEKILEMLRVGDKSKQAIAKELGTYYSAVDRVAKLYL